ncbi:hypothetical protein BS47DRAFT_1346796 [Hydnum rufescens UP504]|uniref:Uncharacterized protein n=1 Tax=Hydnum rufescens UP504 TaxID=1448309 RepID=A0A9P6AT87_9AGAM|nr:hypothetical protein BS47DRAFT_1346796 [Hydnum rufescens UP504]
MGESARGPSHWYSLQVFPVWVLNAYRAVCGVYREVVRTTCPATAFESMQGSKVAQLE